MAHRLGGVKAALALAERRGGSQFDPSLSAALRADPEGVLGGLDSTQTWDSVIDAEPSLRVTVAGDDFDRALLAIADFVDLKSPYTLGHARAVADLAAETAIRLGLPEDEVIMLRRAALVHDLGRLGVSNAIWDKPGPLGARGAHPLLDQGHEVAEPRAIRAGAGLRRGEAAGLAAIGRALPRHVYFSLAVWPE